ncbi:MAG: VWA domain-containing protein [Deltaproteobacteria bacterium]|nr:VWA domain-containing protein [Deltaproteobacteria bacterium]
MTHEGGLRSVDGKPIPLRGVDVSGEVVGGTARMKIRQRYENVETTPPPHAPIEAIYVFPLPSESTLVGFVMECEGRRIEGVCKEREEAFRAYDDATLEGHGAALVEQERANVFTASVGNLLPGETTVVEVEYVQRLRASEGALRVVVPTLVAPRYIPGTSHGKEGDRTAHGAEEPTDRVPDADRISPKIAPVDYRVSLDLLLHVGPKATVSSPSHRLDVQRDGERARVSFSEGRVALDRDVVILTEGAEDAPVQALVAHRSPSSERGTFVFSRVVDLFADVPKAAPLDVVFVLDRSGSMGGSSIEEAHKALRLCLRQLREGDRFSIIAFDDREEPFTPEPVPFTQKTLEQADRWISRVDARGGTELLAPMQRAIALAPNGVVVLLTDGQVGNEDEILAAVMTARGKNASRVYTFGIGTNVSDALLSQLARRTGGAMEMIHPGERIDDKVVATFARAIASRIREVRATFHGVDVDELAPSQLPDLVDGEVWSLFGRYQRPGIGRLEVRGTLAGKPWLLEVALELPERADAPVIEKLWAAERVRDLESIEVEGRRAKSMKDRIVAIAVPYGIASRHTSFVAIEKRTGDRRVPGAAEARPVPVNAPAGWAMFERPPLRAGGAFAQMMMPMAAPAPAAFAYARAAMPPTGAPPPPMASMPMSPQPAAQPKRAKGVLGRARDAIGGFFGGEGEGAAPRQAPPGRMMESAPAPLEELEEEGAVAQPRESGDPVFAILSRQLANGLFDDGGPEKDEDARLAASTERALLSLLRLGVDGAHALHGEVVRKAVLALLPVGARLKDRAAAERVLLVAWLAASSSSKRTRKQVVDAARAAKLELASRTADEPALRASLGL